LGNRRLGIEPLPCNKILETDPFQIANEVNAYDLECAVTDLVVFTIIEHLGVVGAFATVESNPGQFNHGATRLRELPWPSRAGYYRATLQPRTPPREHQFVLRFRCPQDTE